MTRAIQAAICSSIALISLMCNPLYGQTIQFDTIAFSFLGVPYEAHTLDKDSTEKVVVNLSGVDCTTFVEYVVASLSFDEIPDSLNADFYDAVRRVRYRDGRVGYGSRHHYFSDFIESARTMGLLEELTPLLGGIPAAKPVDYMTMHADAYPQFNADPALYDSIRERELLLSATPYYYIPKEEVAEMQGKLREGDLIAVTTDIPGLDIQHVGFAYPIAGVPHLMHASTTAHRVVIDSLSLSEYLARVKTASGIRVMRLTNKNMKQ